MSSRTILLLGFFLLGCLILLGSAAVHLAVGSEEAPSLSVDRKETPRASSYSGDSAAGTIEADAFDRPAAADTLEALLADVWNTYAVDSSSVSESSIPLFAEMIAVLNRETDFRFVIQVSEQHAALAADRAESLRNAILLNVRDPSRLEIVAAEGQPSVIVEAAPYHSTSK